MTARALYDKHSRALKQAERIGYREGHWQRTWPVKAPVTWDFLGDDERRYFEKLAKLLTPPRRAKS